AVFLLKMCPPILRHRDREHAGCSRFEARLHLLFAHARARPRHHIQPPVATPVQRAALSADERLRTQRNGNPDPASDIQPGESRRGDTDNFERVAVEPDGSTARIRPAAVPRLPVVVTKHRDWRASTTVVGGRKRTANRRRYSERVEEAAAGIYAVD